LSWFDIVKVLSSKTGYAQLDFDNIVEEDEDNCKRRWQELCNKIEKATKEVERKLSNKDVTQKPNKLPSNITLVFDDKDGVSSYIESIFLYDPDVPEEVYCVALDMLNRNMNDVKQIENYVLHSMITSYESNTYLVNRRMVFISDKKYDDKASLGYSVDMIKNHGESLRNLIIQDLSGALK
jgi:hypothetical protein